MASILDNMIQPGAHVQAQAPVSNVPQQAPQVNSDPSVASKVVGAIGNAAGIAAMFL